MLDQDRLRQYLPVIGAATSNIIIFVAVLSIPLTAAQAMGLSPAETSSWILALYGLPGSLSLILSARYRQPLLLTGNLFMIVFINGLGGEYSFAELKGAAMLAGAIVLLIAWLGISEWLATWIPVPIMFGLLAGAILPFVVNVFTRLGEAPLLVGGTVLAYLVSRYFMGTRWPAILPALLAGVAIAALTGQFGSLAGSHPFTPPTLNLPDFSLPAILTATPVFVVLVTLQANLPSLRFLRSQEYQSPEGVIGATSGLGTLLGSLLGPTGVSLSLPATSLVAGSGAGEHSVRYRAASLVGGAALVIGLLAGIAAALAGLIPIMLLITLAGLSVVEVLSNALMRITHGPLRLGPLFAFAIALSDISFLGFGNYFWSLVIGTGVSLLLERDGLRGLQGVDDEESDAK